MSHAGSNIVTELPSLRKELEEFHQFWSIAGIDKEHGGFMTALDHSGQLLSEDKFIWYQGRGLWVYSRLFRLHGRSDSHLDVARRCYKFIVDKWADPDTGQWAVQTNRSGASETIKSFENLVLGTTGYGGAFIAEGMAEYFRASGEAHARDLALKGLKEFDELVNDPDHTCDSHAPSPKRGLRGLGASMITLSLSRQMLEEPSLYKKGSVEYEWISSLSDKAVEQITTKFYHPTYDLLGELLTYDWKRPDNANEDFVYLGHGIETLWMVMAEATRKKDTNLFNWAARLFKRHVDIAWDPIFGGVFRGLHVKEHKFLIDADCKVKWAQDEVLVGCMILMEHEQKFGALKTTESSWAVKTFIKMKKYMDSKFRDPLRARGLPYVLVGGDRQVTFKERYVNAGQPGAPSRKEHYHHPRMLMLLIESLQRFEEREDS